MLFEKEVDRRMHQTVDDGGHGEDSTDDSHNSHEQLMPLFIFYNCEDSDRVGLISAIRGYTYLKRTIGAEARITSFILTV